jgi:hypothetical protein
MKKNYLILALLLCIALLVTACGGSSNQGQAEQSADPNEKVETKEPVKEEKSVSKSSKIKTIAEFSELWDDLYKQNERVINEYEGMPIMQLVTPSTCFISGVQYDLLNLENKNGRFEGELMFAGYQGFVEKDGSMVTFGYDDVLEQDGFGISSKSGDRKVENGICDLEKVYFYEESYTEREGKIITRSISEFRQEKDGSMSCFVLSGNSFNLRGDESKDSEYLFIRNGKDQYDFVIANGQEGPDFKVISLKDHENLTKEKAIELFEDAGYVVEKSGGIVNGKLTLD